MKSALFMLLLSVSGCGAAGGAPSENADAGGSAAAAAPSVKATGDDDESIQGGAKDGKDPAVGLVWFHGGGFCSGTLVAPNVVLTAGHCVEDPVDSFYTGEGEGASTVDVLPAGGLVKHKVIDQVAYPSYRSEDVCPNSTFDVGLLRLSKAITTIAPLPLGEKPPKAGASCRAVGYGVHNSGAIITVEQRRSGTEEVSSLGKTSVKVARMSGIVDHGDSGGPLLCASKIVGTTSCGNQSSPQQTEAYYARVDTINAWIEQTVAGWN